MVNWDDRRFFLALARSSSVRRAAATLNTSRSTVMRRISALEAELGARLFERMPDGYYLTPGGEEMLRATERMEAGIATADRRLSGRDTELGGTIRVSLPGSLAGYLLMPDITGFCREHPEIRLEITSTYDMPEMVRREADIAILVSNDPPDDLVGRRLLKIARTVYVSAKFLKADGEPALPSGLGWIGWSPKYSARKWAAKSGYPDLPVTTIITDPYATAAAVRNGLGIALLPCFVEAAEPGIRRMPPGKLLAKTDLWVLTHEYLRNTARIRLFTSFISKALLRHRDLIEGKNQAPV